MSSYTSTLEFWVKSCTSKTHNKKGKVALRDNSRMGKGQKGQRNQNFYDPKMKIVKLMWKLTNNSNKNMKYNCSRRSFNLKIQQILGSHELKCHCHFCHAHPKIFESTFSFPKFVSACKKSVYSICWVLRYSQFRVQWPDWQQPFFTMLTQNFLINF